jgi:hypothetical protein
MSGKKSRNKGHNYERKIRLEMIEMGWEDCQTSRFASKMLDDAGVDLACTDPFQIQCKAVEKGCQYTKILASMPDNEMYNVIFHKKDRKEYAIMSKNDFYELLKIMKKEKLI